MKEYAIVQVGHSWKTYYVYEWRDGQRVEPYIEQFRRRQDAVDFIIQHAKGIDDES